MRRLPLVVLFAAALAAQKNQPPAPPQELNAAIAVEEQEGDLGKAEAMYRELLADQALPNAARSLANLRLGRLLQKLGKADAAKSFLQAAKGDVVSLDDVTNEFGAQDAEREKALREQAQALLQEPGDLIASDISWQQLSGPLPERLLWIGKPAVPAIIATLENRSLDANTAAGLFALLWRIGSGQAKAFLARSLADESRRAAASIAAAAASDGEMLDFAGKQVAAIDWPTAKEMLSNTTYAYPKVLWDRLPTTLILDLAEKGPAEVAAYVLDLYRTRAFFDAPALAERFAALVKRGLSSTSPELGTAAERALESALLNTSIAGIELLLETIPAHAQLRLQFTGLPKDMLEPDDTGRVTLAAAQRLWPKSVACALQLHREHPSRAWLSQLLTYLGWRLDAAIVNDVFVLSDAGYEVIDLLQDKVDGDNAAEVLARADRVRSVDRERFLRWFEAATLPESLFPKLRDLAEQWGGKDPQFPVVKFAMPMARTGATEAAAWMLACPLPNGWGPPGEAMLELARRNPGEEVRAAMRQMLQVPGSSYSSELTMALLAMHDEPTLDLVLAGMQKEQHPYAQVDAGSKPEALTPLQYLLYDNPNPPHGFSVEDVRKVIAGSDSSMVVSPFDCAIERLSDAMLRMLAESQFGSWRRADRGSTSWQLVAMQRYREHQGQGRWKEWLHAALTTDKLPAVILEHLNAEEIEQNLATIEALRNNPKTAIAALDALQRAGKPIDIPALLADDNREPRLWAFHQVASGKAQADDSAMVPFLRDDSWPLRKKATEYLGAKVCTAAVPGLINLLRDPEEQVRTTAADALTKIRFYHEQQAHWDRVLKGLDASPASAMEKLLLQCKPDAPKAQRLLAITSLGTLGAPEALPFLIDWSNEADAEVAAAAKAAITQIHLQPRR